jgi:hypothetical protein
MFERISSEFHLSEKNTSLGVFDLSNLPFRPERLYWISDMLSNEPRGFHAHKKLNQVLIVVEGSIQLKLCRGSREFLFDIKKNDAHIFIPFGTWREIIPITEGATILVIADRLYEVDDYISDWNYFLTWFSENFDVS